MAGMKHEDENGVCSYCGPSEKCHTKRHNRDHLRDLLVDANVIEDTDASFAAYWRNTHKYEDKEEFLMGYAPDEVWNVINWRVARFVRSVL